MGKKIQNFWNLNINQFARQINQQIDFYIMLKTSDQVKNFVYLPSALSPSEKDQYNINNKTFSDASFVNTNFENITFTNCKFINCKFNHSTFRNCRFHDCDFKYVNMFRVSIENTYINPNSFKNIIPNITDFLSAVKNANMVVSLFQVLLENSRREGQPDFEKIADYHFQKWKGLNYIQKKFYPKDKNSKVGWLRFIKKFVPNLILYITIGYGFRVVNFLIMFLIGFSTFFSINEHNWKNYCLSVKDVHIDAFNPDSCTNAANIFYTLDATTKLVDCEFHPTSHLGMTWLTIQGIFGFFLLSGLITILLNKYIK